MGNAVDYSTKTSPVATDYLLGVDTPGGAWSVKNIPTTNLLGARINHRTKYYVDPNESDHGAAGSGASLKDILDTLGTATPAEIIFTNNGTGAYTDYTIGTTYNASAYTLIVLTFENGARLIDSGNPDFTWGGGIDIAKNQQGFNWTGTGSLQIGRQWTNRTPHNFGALGDDSNDDTDAIQTCFSSLANTAITGNRVDSCVTFLPGVYRTTDELTIDFYLQGARFIADGNVIIHWDGGVDATKAVIRLSASSGKTIDHLVWDGIYINGDDEVGYCIRAEGTTGGTYSVKNCTFKNMFLYNATVANFLGGDDTEPADYDTDFSQNLFDHCIFYNATVNVQLNGTNVYNNTFRSCSFGSNVTGAVNQHARLTLAGATYFNQCHFTALTGTDDSWPDATVCVYVSGAGGVSLRDIESEECRIISVDNISRVQDIITIDNVYVNDVRASANGVDLDPVYSAYFNTGRVTMSNCYLAGYANPTWYNRKIYASSSVTGLKLDNVVIGPNGIVDCVSVSDKTTIEGVKSGVFKNLISNWNFERLKTDAAGGSDDSFYEWSKVTSAGSTYTVEKDTTNNVFGTNSLMIDCTTQGSTNLMGVESYILAKNADYVTVVFHGKVSASTVVPSILINSASRIQGYCIQDDLTFSAWGQYDSSAVAFGQMNVAVGMSANVVNAGETMYIDRVLVLPGRFPTGSATGLQTAYPDPTPAIYHGSAAPTTGSWLKGDKILNTTAFKDGNNMINEYFYCITGGSPGTWETMYISTVSPAN